MRKLLLFVFLPVLIFGQARTLELSLWGGAGDTIGNYTKADTLQYRKTVGTPGPWNDITIGDGYITVAEKLAETTQEYDLSEDAKWSWMSECEFRLQSGNGGVSTTAKVYGMGRYYGAFTAMLMPDTVLVGTCTKYTLKIGGN
jgi:hypothetical protein